MQAGSPEQRQQLIDLGKEIYTILRTEINPIPDSEIDNPNIWNNASLQNKLAQIKHKFGPDDTFAKQLMAKAFIVYLYSIAHALGHKFDEGTFVIHDNPQGLYDPAQRANVSAILAFLANMPGVNRRGATHFSALERQNPVKYAHLTSSGSKTFYGLNLDLTKETQKDEQPKTTILFNRVESTQPSLNFGNQKRPAESDATFFKQTPISIFIKPERFGTKNYGELALHAGDLVRTKLSKLMGSEADDQPKYSKERVPVYLQKAFDKLIDTTIAHADAENKTRALNLKQYNTHDGWGIQKYLQLTDIQKHPITAGEDVIVRFAPKKEIEKFRQLILANQTATLDNGKPDLLKRAKYTHLKDRFGHEVSLDGIDLAGQQGESSQSGSASIQY